MARPEYPGHSRLKCRRPFPFVLSTVTPLRGNITGRNWDEIRQLLGKDPELVRKAARLLTLVVGTKIPDQAG